MSRLLQIVPYISQVGSSSHAPHPSNPKPGSFSRVQSIKIHTAMRLLSYLLALIATTSASTTKRESENNRSSIATNRLSEIFARVVRHSSPNESPASLLVKLPKEQKCKKKGSKSSSLEILYDKDRACTDTLFDGEQHCKADVDCCEGMSCTPYGPNEPTICWPMGCLARYSGCEGWWCWGGIIK